MRRAVITGIGIISSIGDNKDEVLNSLKAGRSGISFAEEYAKMGFRSHVYSHLWAKPDGLLCGVRRIPKPPTRRAISHPSLAWISRETCLAATGEFMVLV